MSRGKRYDTEQKLNIKKVLAVIIAIAVIVMFVITIGKILKTNPNNQGKVIPTHYISVYTNGNWGVINSKAEQVIAPQYSEMIVIPNKEKAVFLCVYDVDYSAQTYKTKAINANGETLFAEYEKVEPLINNKDNKIWYEKDLLKVQKDGKLGLIDLSGKVILNCEYEKIETLKGVENSIITVKDGKLGLVDTVGNVIINNEYKQISALENYSDGYIVTNFDNKCGVINYSKQLVVECKYDSIKNKTSNGNYIVKIDGNYKVLNSEGQALLDSKYEDIKDINESYAIVKNNKKYGVVNLTGEGLIEATYQDISFAFSNYFIAKKDDKYALIDSTNTTISDFIYSEMEYNKKANCIIAKTTENNIDIIDSTAAVKVQTQQVEVFDEYVRTKIDNTYEYYNLKFENKTNKEILSSNTIFVDCKDGKYGFVNKDGKVIVDYKYEDATEQNDYGYVAVKLNGKWGALDQYGNVVVEPTYELKNNTLIDFIGKWHVSEDLNANYYTDM